MQSGFKEHLLNILTRLIKAIKTKKVGEIKDLSNQTIHSLTIFQDQLSRDIAVLTYSIYKIISRPDYAEKKGWKEFYNSLIENLTLAKSYLKNNETEKYSSTLKKIQQEANLLEPKLKQSIKEIFESSKIAKASRVTEHGVSLGQAAKTLKTSPWELQEYTGKTGIAEKGITKNIKKRLEFAKSLFQ